MAFLVLWALVGWAALLWATCRGTEFSFRGFRNDSLFAVFMVLIATAMGPLGVSAFGDYKDI